MDPKRLLFLWIYLIHPTGMTDPKTRCKIPSVQKGEATNITCYFGNDISQTRTDCAVRKYDNDDNFKDILSCLWPSKEIPKCKADQGYSLRGNVTDTLVLQIPSAGEKHVGTYVCLTIPSDPRDLEPCTFTLNSGTSPVSTLASSTESTATSDNTSYVVVVVVVAVVIAVSAGVAAVVIYIKVRRRRRKDNIEDDEEQNTVIHRLLHQDSEPMEQDKKFMFNYNTYDTARNLLEQEGVVVIMGPEKCGKTTIGRALQRHFRKDYISLHLEGRDSLKRCRRVSGKRIVLLDEVFMFSETLIDVALWSQVFKSMQKSGCLVIVIIKTVTNPEDVQHNLPHFLDKCPKISVATYLKDELFQCCEKGGLKDLKGLVCHGADVNVVNEKGESPLHIACTRGRVDIVKQLLEVKANPDVQNRQGQTPLHYACSRDVATNVTLDTTDSTTNIDKVDDDPSMHAATQFSDETITTQCVESYFKDEKPDTSAHDETKDQHNRVAVQHDKITRLLLNAGADPEAEDNTGHTPLHVACHKGNRAVVASLLSRSPNPDVQLSKSPNLDVQDRDGATALHMACERGDYAIVSLLIMAGANKEAEDKKHTRALHVACRNGHTDIIKHLLGSHCDKEARDEQQWTPLHWACENGKEAAVSLLLEAGANIEAEDKSGFRPLHVASGHGNDKIVQVLLGRGASVKAKTSNGEKASDLAKRLGHQKVVKLFK